MTSSQMGDGMDLERRIEDALRAALTMTAENPCPPLLAAALDHAVFPGGQRLRPRLVTAVAFLATVALILLSPLAG